MVRRYEEPIEVRSEPQGADASSARDSDSDGDGREGAPAAFIWRGRLYVVREVLGHWQERRAWWREALDPAEGSERPERPERAGSVALDLEQEVWRVAASPGRMHAVGVYDLGHDRGWRLLRVAD